MERVFTELTPEVDYTAQLYGVGKEKQEVADMKFRALATINNQIMTAFEILGIRNRSELTLKLAERISGKQIKQMIIASCLLLIIAFDIFHETSSLYRGIEIAEISRLRRTKRPKEFDIEPLLI
ncbi:DNA-binding response regulator [Dysgonomonas mossii]|uniref:DNA-binding response regulator n=1 Tax=Dysgonomonas mossii TaxID=163665 RepID=UPI003991443C